MFVNQKAQEIGYALVRVAPYIRRQELRNRIERLAFQLLEETASENFEAAARTNASLESLLSLGKSIYEIEPVNANIIIGEIRSLASVMRKTIGLEESEDQSPNLSNLFSKVPAVVPEPINAEENIRQEMRQSELPSSNGSGNGNGIAATIRQSALIEKIRQSENRQIQLRDLLAAFPEASERTMRYDLQKLCAQGLVERVGNGGPASYYALKA